MKRAVLPVALVAVSIALFFGCSSEPLPTIQGQVAEERAFADVLANPTKYSRKIVRLTGWCRIEFEGNSLYLNQESSSERNFHNGLWLQLGWPVTEDIQRLDGQRVMVTATFNPDQRGHLGMWAGALTGIERIEKASSR